VAALSRTGPTASRSIRCRGSETSLAPDGAGERGARPNAEPKRQKRDCRRTDVELIDFEINDAGEVAGRTPGTRWGGSHRRSVPTLVVRSASGVSSTRRRPPRGARQTHDAPADGGRQRQAPRLSIPPTLSLSLTYLHDVQPGIDRPRQAPVPHWPNIGWTEACSASLRQKTGRSGSFCTSSCAPSHNSLHSSR
jgi:hypothetical protein